MRKSYMLLLAIAVLPSEAFAANSCGTMRTTPQRGYIFKDDTLVFPGGGTHKAPFSALQQAYGLVGPANAMKRTRFADGCGQTYQVGYRIEGKTLVTPEGGRHGLLRLPEAEAEALLRKTYGLVGKREALVRTKW